MHFKKEINYYDYIVMLFKHRHVQLYLPLQFAFVFAH